MYGGKNTLIRASGDRREACSPDVILSKNSFFDSFTVLGSPGGGSFYNLTICRKGAVDMKNPREIVLTPEGLQKLQDELDELKLVKRKEISEQLKVARSFGDLSENSEYDEAKNEQAKLYGRIAEVENILAHAVIIDESEEAEGRIGLGCTIKVEDIETGDEELYAIVGSQEANPMECRISDESPFGRAIIGKTEGETFEVEAPVGTLRFEILSISR